MSCPQCEKNRQAGKRFCTACGARLFEEEAPARVEPEPVQPEGEWQDAPAQNAAPQSGGQWQDAPAPEPAPAPVYSPVVEPEIPKKKSSKALIAIIGLIAALAVAAGALFATGVISFGDKSDKEDTEETDKDRGDADDEDDEDEKEEKDDGKKTDKSGIEIVSNSDCAVTVRGFEESADKYTLLLAMENKTDEVASFNVTLRGINGYALEDMAYGIWDEAVEPEDTVNKRLEFPKEEYEIYQLGDVELVTLDLDVYEDDDWDNLFQGTVSFRPDGKDPAGYTAPEKMAFAQEQTILDQDGVLVTFGSPTVDEWNDFYVLIYFENTTDSDVEIDMDNVRVNGKELEFGSNMLTLPAKSIGYGIWKISEYTLEDVELTPADVREIAFDLEAESWDEYEPFFTGPVTYAFE